MESVVTKLLCFICRSATAAASCSAPGSSGERQTAATKATSDKERQEER